MTARDEVLALANELARAEQAGGESRSESETREVEVVEALMQETATRGYDGIDTSPHEFVPLKRWRNRGRCRSCMAHESWHPAVGWLPARPYGDDSAALSPFPPTPEQESE